MIKAIARNDGLDVNNACERLDEIVERVRRGGERFKT